jgi:hypothetical protein
MSDTGTCSPPASDKTCPRCGRRLPWWMLARRPCEKCLDRERRACLWAGLAGPELLDAAERIGVGRLFCRNEQLPSYADVGLADQLTDRPMPKGGLLIVGPIGAHKTHLLCARTIDAARRGWTARLIKWAGFLQEVRTTYSQYATRTELDVVRFYAGLDYLGIDDLGVGRAGGVESELSFRLAFDLLDSRYETGRTTDVTSNCLPDELGERFDARILRRVLELCVPYPMMVSDDASERMSSGGF